MKSLKMKSRFLCFIFWLQILLALDTVRAADSDLSKLIAEQTELFEAWLKNLDAPNGGDAGIIGDDRIPTEDDGDSDLAQDDDPMNSDDDDDWRQFINLDGENTDNRDSKKDLGENTDNRDSKKDLDEDMNIFPNNRNDEIKAKDIFKWPVGTACDKQKDDIDRSLMEARTLSDNAIAILDTFLANGPGSSFDLGLKKYMVPTAQFWGVNWVLLREPTDNTRRRFYHTGYSALKVAKENFEFFLGNLTDLSKSEKRVPLVCSQEDATQEVDKDGEEYIKLKDFKISLPVPETAGPALCDIDGPNTSVWAEKDLVFLCDSVWKRFEKTLKTLIDEHKTYPATYKLDDMMTLGSIMMHLLMHVFDIADDVEIIKEDYQLKRKPYIDDPKKLTTMASSYYWCAALGEMDFTTKKVGRARESIRNLHNSVMYAIYVTLNGVVWGKRDHVPEFSTRLSHRKPSKARIEERKRRKSAEARIIAEKKQKIAQA